MPTDLEPQRPDIVAVGASAGGIEALVELVGYLPENLPASVLVVLHRPISVASGLPRILRDQTRLRVVVPREGDLIKHGVCYVGDPDRHLTVGPDMRFHLLLDGFYRAHNIDALFTSLSLNAGKRTIGVILSGMRKDGSLGLKAIKQAGGFTLVQSPQEAIYPEMPESAIKFDGPVDLVGPVQLLAERICEMVGCGSQSQSKSSKCRVSRNQQETHTDLVISHKPSEPR